MDALQAVITEYLDNLKRVKDLSDFRIDHNGDVHAQIEEIRAEAHSIFSLQRRNNQILESTFFSRDPAELTDQEAQAWDAFAISLVDGYKQQDLGLSYRLHCMLLDRAKRTGRQADALRQLYYCGLTLYYLELPLFNYKTKAPDPRIRAYFHEGMDFLRDYAHLDRDSRAFIMRCAGNLRLGLQMPGKPWHLHAHKDMASMDADALLAQWLADFDTAYALATDPNLRAMQPDLPWEDYVYSLHFGRTTLIPAVRDGIGGENLKRLIYESACYIYQRQERATRQRNIALPSRLVYVYAAARYHMGIISAEELMEILLTTAEQANGSEVSAEATYRILGLSPYLRYYFLRCTPEGRARYRARVKQCVANASHYLSRLPRSDYFSQTTAYIRNLVETELIDTEDESAQYKRETLLKMMLLCHRPTFVHSMTVAWLTKRLTQRLLEVQPELLLSDVAGIYRCDTLEQAQAQQNEVLDRVYEVGLYHDVGKIGILDVVGIYGRRLTNEEFRMIQQHPFIGYVMLTALGGMPLCAEGALYHHRFFNEHGGYPGNESIPDPRLCPLMTDVLSIADSLDAATDDVGRSYAQAKTLDMLAQEMCSMRDTRYAGYVLTLLEDKDFLRTLEQELKDCRQRMYLYVYSLDDNVGAL